MRLELVYPVTAHGSHVRAVLVRRPGDDELEELRRAWCRGVDPLEIRLEAFARFTDLPRSLVDEMDVADLARIDHALEILTTNMEMTT